MKIAKRTELGQDLELFREVLQVHDKSDFRGCIPCSSNSEAVEGRVVVT